ncbi:MAG: SRPBCC family protein [Myxococcota bacterium]
MRQVDVKRTVNASSDRVWAALADFGGVHRFHPGVESSPILNAVPSGVGAKRACHFYGGGQAIEEVVAVEDGVSMTVDVLEGPLPAQDVTAVFTVAPLADDRSEVTITMDYRPKFGPLGAALNAVAMRGKITGLLDKVLEGLSDHLEHGVLIGPKGVPQGNEARAAVQ